MRSSSLFFAVVLLILGAGPSWGQMVRLPFRLPVPLPGIGPRIPVVVPGSGQHGDNSEPPGFVAATFGYTVFFLVLIGLCCALYNFSRHYMFVSREQLKSVSGFIGTSEPISARIVCSLMFLVLLGLVGLGPIVGYCILSTPPAPNLSALATSAGLIGLGTIGVLVLRRWPKSDSMAGTNGTTYFIRITMVPPGDAPEQIRRAWIGVELPLRNSETEPTREVVVGALSGKVGDFEPGFVVDGAAAINCLAAHSPEAATWWRQNAPHVLQTGYDLFFPSTVCERVARDAKPVGI
jgi:hypothetical protein